MRPARAAQCQLETGCKPHLTRQIFVHYLDHVSLVERGE